MKPLPILLLFALPAGAATSTPETTLRADPKLGPILEARVDADLAATLSGGNSIYTVYVDDFCGVWTAQTAAGHPVPGVDVLYGTGFPGTSYTSLRSYTSGTDYSNGSTCTDLCAAGSFSVEAVVNPGPPATTVGYRTTWSFTDGFGGPAVELIQEVVVEGPVDGSETVDNTVIRETHTVVNSGPGLFEFGLRKMWDWQIGPDDGPWYADCDAPTEGCDRSFELTEDGSLDGLYPPSYGVNDNPETSACPGMLTPLDPDGCGGPPLYTVAGTISPPSTLVPEPTAPAVFQFNSWPDLTATCWLPALDDAALCGDMGTPIDDTAAAYFYGFTAATAEALAPGEETSFTQYVVAAAEGCAIFEPLVCDAGGPYEVECGDDIILDGSFSSGSGITFDWSTDCAATLSGVTSPTPSLLGVTGPPPCPDACTVTLTVEDETEATESCEAPVTVTDTTAPTFIDGPADEIAECDAVPPPPTATAGDVCDADVDVMFIGDDRTDGACEDSYTLDRTWEATDDCDNVATHIQTLTVDDTTPPDVVALLMPVPAGEPGSATSPAAPSSVCSAPASGRFLVVCDGTDNCDPDPALTATLVVSSYEVPAEGECVLAVEEIPVVCGEVVEIRLDPPACPDEPSSPASAPSPGSGGVIVTGESVTLRVTATDRCGNPSEAIYDPTADPDPGCTPGEEPCCPPITPPEPGECEPGACGGLGPELRAEGWLRGPPL